MVTDRGMAARFGVPDAFADAGVAPSSTPALALATVPDR
jgi:hypothetical protein